MGLPLYDHVATYSSDVCDPECSSIYQDFSTIPFCNPDPLSASPSRSHSSSKPRHSPLASWSTTKYHNLLRRHLQSQVFSQSSSSLPPIRPYQLKALGLEKQHFRARLAAYPEPPSCISVRREKDIRRRQRRVWNPSEEDEGREIARSRAVKLPGDRQRERVPSLERQEAFWDGRTVKRKFGHNDLDRDYDHDDEEEQTRELYRLGLLYDHEFERGDKFGFGVLDAARPSDGWMVNVRTTTREKKRGASGTGSGSGRGSNQKERAVAPHPLHLDLSFAKLVDDEALARWLIEPGPDERCFSNHAWDGMDDTFGPGSGMEESEEKEEGTFTGIFARDDVVNDEEEEEEREGTLTGIWACDYEVDDEESEEEEDGEVQTDETHGLLLLDSTVVLDDEEDEDNGGLSPRHQTITTHSPFGHGHDMVSAETHLPLAWDFRHEPVPDDEAEKDDDADADDDCDGDDWEVVGTMPPKTNTILDHRQDDGIVAAVTDSVITAEDTTTTTTATTNPDAWVVC